MTFFSSDIPSSSPSRDAGEPAEKPLYTLNRMTIHDAGGQIANDLSEGRVDQARKFYDSVVDQIRSDTSGTGGATTADTRLKFLHDSMWERDPVDVKTPGHGTADGYYLVYWKPEQDVNEALAKIMPLARKVTGDDVTFANEKDKTELGRALHDLNEHLRTAIPDGLSRWVFKDDFNRRARGSGLEAKMDEYFNLKVQGIRVNELPYGPSGG